MGTRRKLRKFISSVNEAPANRTNQTNSYFDGWCFIRKEENPCNSLNICERIEPIDSRLSSNLWAIN